MNKATHAAHKFHYSCGRKAGCRSAVLIISIYVQNKSSYKHSSYKENLPRHNIPELFPVDPETQI